MNVRRGCGRSEPVGFENGRHEWTMSVRLHDAVRHIQHRLRSEGASHLIAVLGLVLAAYLGVRVVVVDVFAVDVVFDAVEAVPRGSEGVFVWMIVLAGYEMVAVR